jgi:hypothetical protein
MQLVDKDGNIFGNGIEITGPDGKPKTTGGGGGSVSYERKSDFVNPYQYSGTAVVGTLESSPTWTIKRINFTTPGSPITQTAIGAWTNRLSLIYI